MFRFALQKALIGLLILSLGTASSAVRAQRSWDGGNSTSVWGDNGNWDPDGSPSGEPISVGNLASAFNDTTLVDAAYVIDSLLIIGGADVINSPDGGATAFELQVTGLTILDGAGSSMTIFGGPPDGLDTGTLTVDADASLLLNSQQAGGTAVVEVDSGPLIIEVDGFVTGNGRIELQQSAPADPVLLENNGTLSAGYIGIHLNPPATTLRITASDPGATIDLDGSAIPNTGIVNVNRNATLDIDVPISDNFSGVLNMSAGSTLDMADDWIVGGGEINVNTPGTVLGIGGPAAHIVGGELTLSSSSVLTLDDGLDSLVVDPVLIVRNSVVNNGGTITFNEFTHFESTAEFNMTTNTAKIVVNRALIVDIADFDLDGLATDDNVTTINDLGNLDLNLGAGADELIEHTININGGQLDVTTADGNWSLFSDGTINVGGTTVSTIEGDTLQINNFGFVGGEINVAENATLEVNATAEIIGTPAIDIAAGGELNFATVTYGNTGATYTGEGVLRKGTATITADTTWNVATVDLDDGDTTLFADLTIIADAFEADSDYVDGTHTINDGALLTLNGTDSGWRLDPDGTIVYNGNASPETYLAGFEVTMWGTINHTGDGRIDARLDIGPSGVVNILTAGEPLRMSGGNNTNDPNRILSGTINGPGILGADTGNALHGYGTINATIDFDGTANLMADGGTLTVNGAIVDVNQIGTADVDGILNITTAWNTNVTVSVNLNGGELRGAAITNGGAAGINGRGLLSARVVNNTRIDAEGGGTFIVSTTANNNDWDGVVNTGSLNAISGDLEIRDNADFLFNGTVQVNADQEVFASGFELEFEPASTLTLNAGRYRTIGTTFIGGTVSVGAGQSELAIGGTAVFESTSSTTIAGTLRLNSPATQVDSGATFAGEGTLLNTESNFLRLQDGADVDVLVRNRGDLIIGNTGPAQATGLAYQQDPTGQWLVNLHGLALDQFDWYSLTGSSSLAGNLIIDLGGGYVPVLGDTFNILSAVGGVTGSFASVQEPTDLPAGLLLEVVYQPTFVQLVVVEAPLPGDFDADGDVDGRDFLVWQRGGSPNPLSAGDLADWQENYGLGSMTAESQAVPEPSALLLALVTVAKFGWRKRGVTPPRRSVLHLLPRNLR